MERKMKIIDKLTIPKDYNCLDCRHIKPISGTYYCFYYKREDVMTTFNYSYRKKLSDREHVQLKLHTGKFIICYDYEPEK